MDIYKSIQRMNRITNKLSRSLNPTISVQNQIAQSVAPFIEYQEQIRQSMTPFIEYLDNISSNLNSSMQQFVSCQQDILETMSKLNLDISSSHISTESSIEFSQIVSDILDEFNCMEIDELTDSSQEISTCTSSKTTLTWEQILNIILAIITIISFIQDQLPDSHSTNMEKAIYQIIEIEKQQLNLLERLISE